MLSWGVPRIEEEEAGNDRPDPEPNANARQYRYVGECGLSEDELQNMGSSADGV
jgi:hypothetical protein